MRLAAAAMLLLVCAPLAAQSPAAPDSTSRFAFRFRFAFNPDWVRSERDRVGLTGRQAATIDSVVRTATDGYAPLQHRLDRERRDLEQLLAEAHVNEGAALAALERVIAFETELKRLRLQMLIRTKNALTPAQQRRLLQLEEIDP